MGDVYDFMLISQSFYCLQENFNVWIKEKHKIIDVPISTLVLDEIRLRQILFNLIGNAVKFTDKGYIKLSVKKNYKFDDHSKLDLIFSIEDTGIGIPENQVDSIFESFKQQEGQSTKKYGGTGLGLSITRRLIEMMNGRITVKSSLGEGSIFKIILNDVDVSVVDIESDSKDLSFDVMNIYFEKALVMIVDDIESNRVLIKETLTLSGLDILEAKNGEEATKKSMELLPDVILMDIRMPVMDGYQATKIIKSNPKTKSIPVIALTASVTMEEGKINSSFTYVPRTCRG